MSHIAYMEAGQGAPPLATEGTGLDEMGGRDRSDRSSDESDESDERRAMRGTSC